MKIQVLNNYGGVTTNEKRILPGIYEASDLPEAAVRHMIQAGHAIYVRDDIPPTVPASGRKVEDFTFHNEIMKKKGRPIIETDNTVQSEEIEPETLPQAVAPKQETLSYEWIDPDDRDSIRQALDELGIEYSKYANTESLYALLMEAGS